MPEIFAKFIESCRRLLAKRREELQKHRAKQLPATPATRTAATPATAQSKPNGVLAHSPDSNGLETEDGEEEEEEEDEDIIRMKRQVQAHVREARRRTARQSLLLANLVDNIEPSLAEEIIKTDVKPNMSGTLFGCFLCTEVTNLLSDDYFTT